MPTYVAELEGGETLRYYIPEGTTTEEARAMLPDMYRLKRYGVDIEAPPKTRPREGGMGTEFRRGAAGLTSAVRTALGATFGDPEEAAQAALERSEAMAQRYGEGPSLAQIQETYREDGLLPAVGEAIGDIPELLAGQAPQLLSTAAAARTGFMLGGPYGAGLGALASLVPQFTGYNIERQAEAQRSAGEPLDIDVAKAAGTATLQAVPELASQYFILGKGLVSRILGRAPEQTTGTAAREAAEQLKTVAERSLRSTVGRGAVRGAATEIPTEVAQQVLERAQAGLDVLSPDALAEYGESAYLAGVLGGTLGPVGGVSRRGQARRQLEARGEGELTPEELEALAQPAPEPEAEAEAEVTPPPVTPGPEAEAEAEAEVTPEPEAEERRAGAALEPQLEPFPELLEIEQKIQTGEKTTLTEADLTKLGVNKRAPIIQRIRDKDLTDAAQRQEVFGELDAYRKNTKVKPQTRRNIVGLLNSPVFESDVAAPETAAPEQITIEEGIAEQQREEAFQQVEQARQLEREQAARQREEAFQQAEIAREEQKAQQEAAMRAAQAPEGTPTQMEVAMRAAQERGRAVPGEPQLEIPTIEPVDRAAQEAATSEELDRQIAAEQRRIAEVEAAPVQEQGELIGPRGGPRTRMPAADRPTPEPTPEPTTEPTPEPTPEQAAKNRVDDVVTVSEMTADNPAAPYLLNKRLDDGLIELAADMSAGLTAKNQAAFEWVKENLSQESRRFLAEEVRVMREAIGLPLPAKAIAKTTAPLSTAVRQQLQAGNLQGALEALAQDSNKQVARVARALANAIGETKIVQVSDLRNESGEVISGTFDPKTNTITLNSSVDLTNHTLLHEAAHAVTSHELARNTPTARQLRALYEAVKDRLDTAYGATSLDEFVAEAFSNPEFQAKLARITNKGEDISLWSRFKNLVENIVRRLRQLPTKNVTSAKSDADKLIAELISPAPEFRDATNLNSAEVENREAKVLNDLARWTKDRVKPEDLAAVSGWMESAGRNSRRLALSALPLNAIYELIKKDFPTLGARAEQLFKLIQQKNGERQKLFLSIKDTSSAVMKPFKGDAAAKKVFDEVVAESTLVKVDPAKPRSTYSKDPDKLAEYDRLHAQYWSKLNEAQRGAYIKLRDAYAKSYADLRETLSNRIDALATTKELKQNLRDRILGQLLDKETIDPYFALHRKGRFWLYYEVVDASGQVEVYKETFESNAQRARARSLLEQQDDITLRRVEQYERERGQKRFGGVDTQFAFGLLNELQAAGIPKEFEETIMNAMFDIMPERSLLRAFRPRQGTLGFQQDAIKVFNERMPNFADQLLNIKYDLPFQQMELAMREEVGKYNNTDKQNYAQDVLENMTGYIAFARNPRLSTFSKALKSGAFGMTLGFNVSSVIVNASNLPIVVLPYLAGRYGFTDTMKAMNNARKIYMASGMRRRRKDYTGEEGDLEFDGPSLTHIDFAGGEAPENLRRYETLARLLEMRGQANASTVGDILDMEDPSNTLWTKTNAVMGYMFHQGERFNRQVTAIAAYDLELQKRAKDKHNGDQSKLTQEDFDEAAEQALSDTELTNSGAMTETAPRLAQSNMGSWLMMYKRFGISMYYLQFKMAKQALDKAATPEEKRIAKRQIVGLFASSGLFAGVQGLPLYGAVTALAQLLLLDDEDDDADSIAASFFGEGMYSGVLNAIFGVDVAPRIGMSNLVFRTLPNREQENLFLYGAELFGGPVYGVADRMRRGFGLVGEGEVVPGLESILPSAFANGLRATRYSVEGATTLRGDPIVEDLNSWNIFAQGLGLAPAGYTKQLELNARDKRIDRNINERRTDLLREYYLASKENDTDTMRDLREEMREFSTRHPESAIDGDTVRNSIRQHRVTDEITRQLGGITISPRRFQTVVQKRLEEMGEQ